MCRSGGTGLVGVPIKLDRVQRTNVDPIVYQTYQAVSIFLCSWFVLYYVVRCTINDAR